MRSVVRCLCGLALLLVVGIPVLAQPVRNPDAVAVIVGNRAYTDRDVPPVDYAHNDARAIERYVVDVLGFDRRNVVVVLDANRTTLERALGNERGAGSEMRRLLRPDGTSDLFVYYSGHGMPSRDGSKAILLPVDVAPASAEIDGLPLDVVRRHLETLPARSVTLVIDACFSGQSHKGALERGVSVPYRAATLPPASPRVTELLATDAEQVASWDEERRQGLFTEHFLRAVYGEADKPEYGGRGDGAIRLGAVKRYLDREMTYAAQRTWLRRQTAVVRGGDDQLLATLAPGVRPTRPPVAGAAPTDPAAAGEAALALSSDRRRQVQEWLGALGFDPRGIDGQFGPGTRGAIRAYQRSRGSPETGFLSHELLVALAADGPPAIGRLEEARRARDAVQAAQRAQVTAPVQRVGYPVAVGQSFRDCADCPEMVVIPAGSAGVGETASSKVALREPLAVGKFHVTVAEYRSFVSATGGLGDTRWQNPFREYRQTDRDPVVRVSWDDAKAYVAWLSSRTGHGYRLLTEAEWEYAARAGSTTTFWWGNDPDRSFSNWGRETCCGGAMAGADQWVNTSPVGAFPPNRFGLHDMAGNAWQWVEDCHSPTFPSSNETHVVMVSGACSSRILRGGSWLNPPMLVRSAIRNWYTPTIRGDYIGFRVARTAGR
jgi:formylglycine-generating enzyme required for sulfatase activity